MKIHLRFRMKFSQYIHFWKAVSPYILSLGMHFPLMSAFICTLCSTFLCLSPGLRTTVQNSEQHILKDSCSPIILEFKYSCFWRWTYSNIFTHFKNWPVWCLPDFLDNSCDRSQPAWAVAGGDGSYGARNFEDAMLATAGIKMFLPF